MQRDQRAKKAEDTASKLSSLLCTHKVAQLLQEPLSAAPKAARQAVLGEFGSCLQWLLKGLPESASNETNKAAAIKLLGGLLLHQAVHSAGGVLEWLQQDPQQLAAAMQSYRGQKLEHDSLEGVWCVGMKLMAKFGELLFDCCLANSSSTSRAAAELATSMTQQLLQSGVFDSWTELAQHRQQQLLIRREGDRQALLLAFQVNDALPSLWLRAMPNAASQAPNLLRAAQLLLRQLQSYGALLSTSAAAGSTRLCSREDLLKAYSRQQMFYAEFNFQLILQTMRRQLITAAAVQAVSLQSDPAVAQLLLQLLAVYPMLLHQQHSQQQKQQQKQQQERQDGKQQLRADLLPIPAFHQHPGMLQLLPGGQAYLDAAGRLAAAGCSNVGAGPTVALRAQRLSAALEVNLQYCCKQQQGSPALDGSAPALSAAAVRLVLELQLLAAGAVQRLQQPRQQQPVDKENHPWQLLSDTSSTALLHRQLKAALQAGASCQPPGVLQQAGLQLLQALAAPLQQLQLTAAGDEWRDAAVESAAGNKPAALNQQLLALRAAAPRLTVEQLVGAASGMGAAPSPLFGLAAAHPEAVTALIDVYARSPVLQAADMLLAAEVLTNAAIAVLGDDAGSPGALHDTAAVAGLASAVTSFAKRAAQLTTAAIALQEGQAAAATGITAAFRRITDFLQGANVGHVASAAAAENFPAALSRITDLLQGSLASCLLSAAEHGSATGTSGSSSSSSRQAVASTALLSVVAARSLVQLADAMQAAGPQLLFRCIMARPNYLGEWVPQQGDGSVHVHKIEPSGSTAMHTERGQWHVWHTQMLKAMLQVVLAFQGAGTAAAAATATAAAAAPARGADAAGAAAAEALEPAAAGAAVAGSSSSSSSRSSRQPGQPSSSQPVSWGYLLQLQQNSASWTAKVAAFDAKWPGWRVDVRSLHADSSSEEAMQQTQQQYTDARKLCKALAAAAPLPLVCNNPGCESLARVSEAAAASKRCGRCKCRYCSAACQTADWERHKHACKGMAAAGLTCG
uniref:MYND-type domain-containing protein n=1 Tax=Tetradesmus obliquus TaxID=3088 RepID=A0A383WED8_TETOB|eukprot:jgi/Sobl393_1/12715/SZX70691.1